MDMQPDIDPQETREWLDALEGVLALAGGERAPFTHGSGRLDLARAIANPANPLTARVLVNRVWGWHFGPALVRTPSDFGVRTARPALQKLYADTFANNRLDALVFPTVPRVALPATPEASSPENFAALIQNTDPGSNAGIPGVQLPSGLGATSGLPVGLELDGPAGSDRRLLAIGMAVEAVLGRLPAPRAK